MAEQPWLILTLRRTGGTSLTTFLSTASSFSTIEHEPFNPGRMLGHITNSFQDSGNVAEMSAAVRQAVAERPNIKHCIEIIPTEITRALIDACHDQGYRFIVMTRRNEAKRLASLFLAISTGVWGPEDAERIYPQIVAGTRTPTPIDLTRLRGRVRTDYYSVGRMLSMLRNRQIDYPWLLFEDLYFGETPIRDQALTLARDLGIDIGEDDDRLQAFAEKSGQKSSEIAPYVENYETAVARLNKLCSA